MCSRTAQGWGCTVMDMDMRLGIRRRIPSPDTATATRIKRNRGLVWTSSRASREVDAARIRWPTTSDRKSSIRTTSAMISTVSSAFALLNHQSPVNLPVPNWVPLLVRCVSLPCLNVFFFLAHLPSCLAPMLPTRLIVIAIALHNTRQPYLNRTSRTFQIVTFPFAWAVFSVCITTVFHTLLFRVLSSVAHSLSPSPFLPLSASPSLPSFVDHLSHP
jgi:hypothetical protein